MLDDLLGRTELKERIEELEAERESLERRLESAEESRAEAVSARQAAEERVNRLEDRVAELEDRVERASGDDGDGDAAFRRVEELHDARRDEVLDRLRSVETGPEGALTAMVGADVPRPVRGAFGARAPLVERAAPCLALTDDEGLIGVALAPPLPPEPFHEWGSGFRLPDEWFRPPDRMTFAVVRADLFALGVYEDGERVETEAITADVGENHSKGGFSQDRFERRRAERVAAHIDTVRDRLAAQDPDRLVLAGERTALDALDLDGLPFDAERRVAVDASGDPEGALDAAVRDAFATRLYVL
ncbi:MAG: Vms1/Ankzf1 family peptidyl-tRNA hydrolase [Haloferacaceae archaeon]